jgi:D-beta-D-heptose 7-phosphate kinase/D-beta-D-heptose 1-phosphate adenosyltransferase
MILCSGCFDGLHSGHVTFLRLAQSFCRFEAHNNRDEAFYVAVAPDDYIRTHKGREPYWTQAQRRDTVAEIRGVTQAITQQELTPADCIRLYTPRVFVKGSDWAGRLPVEVVEACRAVGAMIVYLDVPGTHTSEAMK